MTKPVNQAALDLVKHFEGLYLDAYLCPAGVPTIGYGHTKGVTMGQAITLEQAEAFLFADLAEAAAEVDRLVTVPLNGDQREALASFVFNLGSGRLRESTLLKLLNKRDFEGAARQFGVWNKATVNGRKETLSGLVRRRKAEELLFCGQDWRAALDDGPMPQAVEPPTAMKPLAKSVSVQTGAGGLTLAGVTVAAQQARDASGAVRGFLDALPPLPPLPPGGAGWVVAGVLALAVAVMLYRRYDDHRKAVA